MENFKQKTIIVDSERFDDFESDDFSFFAMPVPDYEMMSDDIVVVSVEDKNTETLNLTELGY